MTRILLFFLAIALLISCEKEDFPVKGDGILRNMAGSCGWLIEYQEVDGSTMHLEPTNIADFGLDLEDGLEVKYSCKERNDLGSFCMMGYVVELKKLKKR